MSGVVRYAHLADLPSLLKLARREHAASRWSGIDFEEQTCSDSFADFMMTVGRTVLMSPGGYLAGTVQTLSFSPKLIAIEFALYAEDGHGMALVKEFERWGENMGAVATVVHDYIGNDRLGEVMARRYGYRPLGSALMRPNPR